MRIASDFASVADKARKTSFLPIEGFGIQGSVANVAGNIVRKLIPPAHRLHLKALEMEQALGFKPPPRGAIDQKPRERVLSIRDLLHEVPLTLKRGKPEPPFSRIAIEPATLHEFLFAKGHGQGQEGFYEERNFLTLPLRQLVDFWLLLDSAKPQTAESDQGPDGAALKIVSTRVQEFCRDSIVAEEGLTVEARGALTAVIDSLADEHPRSSQAKMDLVVATPVVETQPLSGSAHDESGTVSWRLHLGSDTHWALRITWPDGRIDPSIPSSAFCHLLSFATDLATLARSDGSHNPLLETRIRASRLAGVQYRLGDTLFPWLAWPLPPLLMFWEVDKLLDEWRHIISPLTGGSTSQLSEDRIPSLVFSWINLGVRMLTKSTSQMKTTPLAQADVDPTKLNWESLRAGTKQLLTDNQGFQKGQPTCEWIVDALSLLNPEVIGPNDLARRVFASLDDELVNYCRTQDRRFISRRKGYLRRKIKPEKLVEELLAATLPVSAWWEQGESRRRASAPASKRSKSSAPAPASAPRAGASKSGASAGGSGLARDARASRAKRSAATQSKSKIPTPSSRKTTSRKRR
jgi:hypothetical protein